MSHEFYFVEATSALRCTNKVTEEWRKSADRFVRHSCVYSRWFRERQDS